MRRFKFPSAYTILFILIALVAALSWIVPAGHYQMVMNETLGKEVPVAGTYAHVTAQPQGIVSVIMAPISGLYDPDTGQAGAIDVALFVLIIGGFLGIVNKTGAIDAGIERVTQKLSGREVFRSLDNPKLMLCLFFTTMVIQMCNGSVNPILTLFVRELAPTAENIAFLSGVIAALPGVSALLAAPRLGRLGDRIGTQRILLATMVISLLLFIAMSFVTSTTQLGVLRFLLGFADGAMMPAVQTLLVRHSRDNITGRIFGYNQSFMYLGNVAGPLLGAAVSAVAGFRWVFFATAVVVLINVLFLKRFYRRPKTALPASAGKSSVQPASAAESVKTQD